MLRLFTFIIAFSIGQTWAQVEVSDATVRLLPPGVPNTAAYFSISNRSDKDVTLIGAEASFVNKAEIHNHLLIDNMMRMQQQDEVLIAVGQTVHFEPSGLHIMLFGLQQVLMEGQAMPLSLLTKSGDSIHFTAKVVRPQAQAHSHH